MERFFSFLEDSKFVVAVDLRSKGTFYLYREQMHLIRDLFSIRGTQNVQLKLFIKFNLV